MMPSIWGVANGSRILGVYGEIIAYVILDVLAKAVFGVGAATHSLAYTRDAY